MPDNDRPITTTDEKLDQILIHLERMDKRDKLRTWGSFARWLISLLPLLFFLWGAWYVVTHVDDVIRKVAEESAKQAAKVTQQQSANMMDKLKNMLPK